MDMSETEKLFKEQDFYFFLQKNIEQEQLNMYNILNRYFVLTKNDDELIIDVDDVFKIFGYALKSSVKKLVVKNLNQNEYSINVKAIGQDYNKSGHGLNREEILLSINGLKKLSNNLSNLKKKELYNFFIKLDKIKEKYAEEKLKETNEKILFKKHTTLLENYPYCPLVYAILIKTIGDKIILKIGKTRKLINRIKELNYYFNVNAIILDVFPCGEYDDFEKYLHKHEKILPLKYTEEVNGKTSTEFFLINSMKHYNELREMIKEEKEKYFEKHIEELRLIEKIKKSEAEIKKIELTQLLLEKCINIDTEKISTILSLISNTEY